MLGPDIEADIGAAQYVDTRGAESVDDTAGAIPYDIGAKEVGATHCDGTGTTGVTVVTGRVVGAVWNLTDVASAADDTMLDALAVGCPDGSDTLATGTDGCASTVGEPGMAYDVCGTKDAGWVMVTACGGAE
jgi:hypothetical protein